MWGGGDDRVNAWKAFSKIVSAHGVETFQTYDPIPGASRRVALLDTRDRTFADMDASLAVYGLRRDHGVLG